MRRRVRVPLPHLVLALLFAAWVGLGLWICSAAPFGSGTDESIRYVAFTAATNRWATAEDAATFGIEHAYYPPLYFLLFAPFSGEEPAFTAGYPRGTANIRLRWSGSVRLVSDEDLAPVPPELRRLYRSAKVLSLLFGAGIVACLVAAVRILFAGGNRPWLVLGTAGPLLLLPQFLYYQTLVNNDCLLNLLGAVALLCFVAAARRSADGDAVGAGRLGVACAVAIGLGLLTKETAVTLAPLLPALAWLRSRSARDATPRQRTRAALRHLLLLASAALVAGGWWSVRSLLAGDPGGLQMQKTMHDWAFFPREVAATPIASMLSQVARSFVAMFAGAYYGIPDRIYALYLAVAATLVVWLGPAALRRGHGRPDEAILQPVSGLVWGTLAGTVGLNLALVLLYNLRVVAPHGRLLFPTLLASGLLFARALLFIARGRRRVLAPLVCALVLSLGALFVWTFRFRMVPAVTQPAEHLVPLGITPDGTMQHLGPVWSGTLQQPVLLPRGRLAGFRVLIERSTHLPQLGAVLHASLRALPLVSEDPGQAFRPCPLGEQDASGRWTEIELETPLELPRLSPFLLELRAEESWLIMPGGEFYYRTVSLEKSPLLKPLLVNGKTLANEGRSEFGLALSAVYD